jgi:predicted lipopolysaccharide heptosyltransferase III
MEIDPSKIKHILVINLAFMGDVVLSTPVIRELQATYPQAAIDMMVTPAVASAAQGNPYVRQVICYDKRGSHKKFRNLWALLQGLRQEKYDLVVSMNFALRGAALAWAIGATYRLGYDTQKAGFFLTHRADPDRSVVKKETQHHLDLLQAIGIVSDNTSLEFQIPQAAEESLVKKYQGRTPRSLIVICPFGRYALKNWQIDKYVTVIKVLSEQTECVLIGGAEERGQLATLQAEVGADVTVLAGNLSLTEVAALLKKAKLLLTVDTGPLHLAAAVGTPIVALFGPTDHRKWGPEGRQDRIFYHQTECWPCGKRECNHQSCLDKIEPQQVIEAALAIVGKN